MSDTYRGKHAGGKYVYGELVFKSDSPFINDGDGLVGVFAATVQVKAVNKWADITDSLYFSLRDNFHIGQIADLRTRLAKSEADLREMCEVIHDNAWDMDASSEQMYCHFCATDLCEGRKHDNECPVLKARAILSALANQQPKEGE